MFEVLLESIVSITLITLKFIGEVVPAPIKLLANFSSIISVLKGRNRSTPVTPKN
jgi:hypothetical protein